MTDQIYVVDEFHSLLKDDKNRYYVVTKNDGRISFKELIEKENELEKISKRYVSAVDNLRLLEDKINMRGMFNAIIYVSSAVFCAANVSVLTGEDKNVGLFVLCLNFIIFKNVLLMAYGTKNAIKKERDNLLKEINECKLLFDFCLEDVSRLENICGYNEQLACDDVVRNMKNKCKKIYQIHR